jgi:hypothetical protein
MGTVTLWFSCSGELNETYISLCGFIARSDLRNGLVCSWLKLIPVNMRCR